AGQWSVEPGDAQCAASRKQQQLRTRQRKWREQRLDDKSRSARHGDGAQLPGATAARELYVSGAQRNAAAVGYVASIGAVTTCSSARQFAGWFARQHPP